MANGVIDMRGPGPGDQILQLGQQMLQFFIQKEQLEQQRTAFQLQKKQAEFEMEQAELAAARQQAEAQGVAAIAQQQQDPAIQQLIQQLGASPEQRMQAAGDPSAPGFSDAAAIQQQLFGQDAAIAAGLEAHLGIQQQQAEIARTQAETGRLTAETGRIGALTRLDEQAHTQGERMFPLLLQHKAAEVGHIQQQTAESQARVRQADEQLRIARNSVSREMAQARIQGALNFAGALGGGIEAVGTASRLMFGTSTFPAIDAIAEEEATLFQMAGELDFPDAARFSEFIRDNTRTRIAQRTGVGPGDQHIADTWLERNGNDPQAAISAIAEIPTSAQLTRQQKAELLVEAAAYYSALYPGQRIMIPREDRALWEAVQRVLRESAGAITGAGVGAGVGGAVAGPPGALIGGGIGLVGGAATDIWRLLGQED
jgi:hypothetical protein